MSLEADFPDSRSAVDSIEGCTVSTVSVSGLTMWTSRCGHKKIREAVITDTKATDTATTEQEAVGAVAMIVQLQGLRERCGAGIRGTTAAQPHFSFQPRHQAVRVLCIINIECFFIFQLIISIAPSSD